jgi:hypothetical protein
MEAVNEDADVTMEREAHEGMMIIVRTKCKKKIERQHSIAICMSILCRERYQ